MQYRVAFIERKWFVFHPICLFAYSQSDLWINARFDFDFETKMVTLLRYLELLESWPNRSKGYPFLGSCKKHAAYLQSSLFLVWPEGNELESGRGWLFVNAWNLHSVIKFRHLWMAELNNKR